jgi:hypothetical protein
MPQPSIQLDLENALKSYLTGISLFVPPVPIYAAHATESGQSDGTYLAISAAPPDWYSLGGYNALDLISFEFYTEVADPDTRAAADTAHAVRTGALIDLFSQQRFNEVLGQLNFYGSNPIFDTRPWKGLGFSAWEEDTHEDKREEKRVVTTLRYEFIVQLEV